MFCSCAILCHAQAAKTDLPAETITSDQPSTTEEAEFVHLACPSRITVSRQGEMKCATCPPNSDFGAGALNMGWSFDGVILGHFTAMASDEAVMRIYGCASHASGLYDDFLFRKVNDHWQKVRFIPSGRIGSNCHKLSWVDQRDALICDFADMHQGQGSSWVQLFVIQAVRPKPAPAEADSIFIQMTDDDTDCDAHIDKVLINPTTDKKQDVEVAISLGRAKNSKQENGSCSAIPRQTYHFLFLNKRDHFEGSTLNPKLNDESIKNCCDADIATSVYPSEL